MTQPVTTRGVRSVPELLLPAGSFDAAIAAIDGGADALYFGFASFSARKQARNFDPLDYRRLLRLARERGIRLYVTLNTIVLERELEEISRLLVFLSRFPPDALIVQDWGLVRLVRDRFPALALHASTQMAVQTPEAASLAAELGVSRIVLPRESSLATLRRFAAALPSMEFEVFVHGALCYSFSGLCLASGTLLGRSGNRGECAQVCRSYYNAPGDGERSESSYWFSCKDLNLAARVAELADAGAASLKVEGRMKAPEYCYSVAQLYRGMLDRLAGEGPDDEELARRDRAARIAFARSPTEAWLFARGGQDMIDAQYPGHRGALAGRIVESGGGRIVVDLESRLGLRDGLLMFEAGDPRRPLPFAVTGLCDARTGREIVQARPGMRVELECPASAPTGSELRRISAREQDRRRPSPEEYPPERQALDADLQIGTEGLSLHIRAPLFPGAGRNEIDIAPGEQLDLQRSRRPGGLLDALSVFSESGDADFVLVPHLAGGEVALPGRDAHSENVELAALFIPPSRLKREKNRCYRESAVALDALWSSAAAAAAAWMPPPPGTADRVLHAPPRSVLVIGGGEGQPSLPFATVRALREDRPLPFLQGAHWLPLAPLVADWEEYVSLLRRRVSTVVTGGGDIILGLDGLHHLALARSLVDELAPLDPERRHLRFFLDIHLYVANRFTFATVANLPWLAGRLLFAYFYLEAGREDFTRLHASCGEAWPELAEVDADFSPPLFLSAACLRKQHGEGGSCPPGCDRLWKRRLRDRDRGYLAVVEDCVSMVFQEGRIRSATS